MPNLWCAKYPEGIEWLNELPQNFGPPLIATLAEFRARINAWFPHADTNATIDADTYDSRRVLILDTDFTISMILFGEGESVTEFMIEVRGEDTVIPAVKRIIDGFGVRVSDRASGGFWNLDSGLAESLREWRAERDRKTRSYDAI